MHYFTFADKDTTIYQASSSMNAGLDEVLEIRKDVSDTGATVEVSRILIRFDLTQVSQSIVDGKITNPKFYLKLYEAEGNQEQSSEEAWPFKCNGSSRNQKDYSEYGCWGSCSGQEDDREGCCRSRKNIWSKGIDYSCKKISCIVQDKRRNAYRCESNIEKRKDVRIFGQTD